MKLKFSVLAVLLSCFACQTVFFLPSAFAEAQLGEAIYKSVSEAVFLLETVGEDGQTVSIGSAFLVADNKLVTNYHVIQGGKSYLRVGSVRIDCSVVSVDPVNDLALLSVQSAITAKPLALAHGEAPTGSVIFVMGNPAGLERTISQGLLSGARDLDGRKLLQISAPISPGSSGGPVVNERGEVVGVAVGFLKEGQNLNFAVPAPLVASLLAGKTPGSLDAVLARAKAVNAEMDQLIAADEGEDPRYSAKLDEIKELFKEAMSLAAGSPEKLLMVARVADEASYSAVVIEAAGAALRLSKAPLPEAHRIMASNLQTSAIFSEEPEKARMLAEAEAHARKVLAEEKQPPSYDYFTLALILESSKDRQAEAYSFFKKALESGKAHKDAPLILIYRGLSRTSHDLKRNAEALSWLKIVIDSGQASAFDWDNLGEILTEENKLVEAGDAWLRAATLDPNVRRLCSAGHSYWVGGRDDDALAAFRLCIKRSTTEKDSKAYTLEAFSGMSEILFRRGVYDESVNFAKQAIALEPKDGFAFFHLAKSLNALKRNEEAIVAAQTAIRLTDGRFSGMHFVLGVAYFDSSNWDLAARAFTKAAELDPTNADAAYNVALSLQKQGFFADAAHWYEEVLKRNPKYPDREEILKRIQVLRK